MPNILIKKFPSPLDYQKTITKMEQTVEKIITEESPENLWLLEHTDTYSAGISSKEADLLDQNIKLIKTGRGGQITYHGAGMRIAYIMLNLRTRKIMDIRKYIFSLEQIIIDSLAELSLEATRLEGKIGIWLKKPNNKYDKIAAIGVRVRKWVTFHGIAINIDPDLNKFRKIVPCGIHDTNYGVTSLAKEGIKISMQEFDSIFLGKFKKIYG